MEERTWSFRIYQEIDRVGDHDAKIWKTSIEFSDYENSNCIRQRNFAKQQLMIV